jgi:DNA-binding CsgD family transcriptional regulator/tetratricopeptide (TPR) repeat protein
METLQVDGRGPLVGRTEELAVLRSAVNSILGQEGSVIWVEGEPGIGKTALAAATAEIARGAGVAVYWATADQFSQQIPLRVMLDCFRVQSASSDPRLAAVADYVVSHPPVQFAINDVVYPATQMLLSLVDEMCAVTPSVIVVDDLQWCDDASLTVWHRLSLVARRLPLLLVGVCHSTPKRPAIRELRGSVRSRGGTLLPVGPLGEAEVRALSTRLLGAVPDALARLVSGAMGNPLYLQELLRAACPDGVLPTRATTRAVAVNAGDTLPRRFVTTVTDLLGFLPLSAVEMLRAATLFGRTFAVADLAVLLRRPVFDLVSDLQEVIAAGLVADAESQLRFHHPLIRQALYQSMPSALRSALHGEVARILADAHAEPSMVAEQLVMAGLPRGAWVRRWLAVAVPALMSRQPELAISVIGRELNIPGLPAEDRAFLALALTRTLLGHGRLSQAVTQARRTIAAAADAASRAEARWLLARAMAGLGSHDEALQTIGIALGQPDLPDAWRARLLTSQSMLQQTGTRDLDVVDAAANEALHAGTAAADSFAIGYALASLWVVDSVRRNHLSALDRIDRALASIGDGMDDDGLHALLLDCRVLTMQNLDRWSEAEATVGEARRRAQHSNARGASPNITAAVLRYWLGQWDDALSELASVDDDALGMAYGGLCERGLAPLWHGVSALIAAHRDDRPAAEHSVRSGLAVSSSTPGRRVNSDFLLAARALVAEQDGDPVRALDILSAVTERQPGEMTLTHQWLPDLVRLAIAIRDEQTAQAGLAACQTEAAAESTPARAAAANHRCRGLVNRDPVELRLAVTHYRRVGLSVELAGTLEDLAEVLAERGSTEEARTQLNEAVHRYDAIGASWDVRRAERRLRAHGIRRGVHGRRRPHAAAGWNALTDTELKVAGRVALAQSTTRIADGMQLSRRTVQTHISHILTKLDARSRVEIAREALRRGVVDDKE